MPTAVQARPRRTGFGTEIREIDHYLEFFVKLAGPWVGKDRWMAPVKGSKQHEMIVVPYRPLFKTGIFSLFVLVVAAASWLTYKQGLDEGMATRVEVVEEKEQVAAQLLESVRLVESMRQEIADLRVGGQIDSRANEEVRQTIEGLQSQIAELNEEIRFYKGIMLPNVEEKGLRIERLDVRAAGEPNRYRYSLLLTQVVDKHEYIQGGVQINLVGMLGNAEASLPLNEVSDVSGSIRFRFRYFQNIDGELTVPAGFEPRELTVIAQASGNSSQRQERKFEWQTRGG